MAQKSAAPFDNIESAHAYVGMLTDALDEAAQMVALEISAASGLPGSRHLDALRLVDYKLHTLRQHLLTSRRVLGDLRTLRRYLLSERHTERDLETHPDVNTA